jgi:hypothetical protein
MVTRLLGTGTRRDLQRADQKAAQINPPAADILPDFDHS